MAGSGRRRQIAFATCAVALGSQLVAQKISIGIIGGGSLTDSSQNLFVPVSPDVPPGFYDPYLGTHFLSASKDYLVGGMIEFRFNPNWSVEADGMFRELHLASAAVFNDGTVGTISPAPVVTWEFPVLAKYRMQRWKVNPFIEAGPSFRTDGNLNQSDPSHFGVTGGLGVEMNLHGVKISPAVRYTRWEQDSYRASASTAPNQVELLVGFSHEANSIWRPAGNRLSLGVTLGTNLTGDFATVTEFDDDNFISTASPGPKKLIVGPEIEVKLPWHLSVEADALYRPLSNSIAGTGLYIPLGSSTPVPFAFHYNGTIQTWEFPILVKYNFRVRRVEPFIGAGPAFRLATALAGSSPYGVVAATGARFPLRRMSVTPSLRYTHWAPEGPLFGQAARHNQTELLVGFTF
jgi:hypothetical protein